MMSVDVTFSGLTTPTFTGFPGGVTSGSYFHVFDISLAASYNPGFITAHGGNVTQAEADLLAGMLASKTYLNIHTQMFGGGEIRGFLHEQVPEPPRRCSCWAAA